MFNMLLYHMLTFYKIRRKNKVYYFLNRDNIIKMNNRTAIPSIHLFYLLQIFYVAFKLKKV